MPTFAPEACHELLMKSAPRELAFKPARDFTAWREALAEKFRELLGWMPEPGPLELRLEQERRHDGFLEIRFVFTSEPGADVPCHLLLPDEVKGPCPVVICLQGHSSGMHISLGRAKSDRDAGSIGGGRDFGLQAVRHGFAALVMEQRCFGERSDVRPKPRRHYNHTCIHAAMTSLLLGRTMIGERVWDVTRAIDALGAFPQVDTNRLACMGNSGGGTVTYYATCFEPRIRAAMPSCSICAYGGSIMPIDHCPDNYIPGALRWFEMGDLAGLIAPRPLIVVAGDEDAIFPIEPTRATFETIRRIYAAAGAEQNCELVVGTGGHRFYPDQAWPILRRLLPA